MLRPIQKWLKAEVSEDGECAESKVGTPQGEGCVATAGKYLFNYAFDLWVAA